MPGSSKRVDLNAFANQPGLSIDFQVRSPESPDERRSRLRREEAEDRHERMMGVALLASVLVVAAFCLWIIAREKSSSDERKWATGLVTSIVSAGLGYVTGKAIARRRSDR